MSTSFEELPPIKVTHEPTCTHDPAAKLNANKITTNLLKKSHKNHYKSLKVSARVNPARVSLPRSAFALQMPLLSLIAVWAIAQDKLANFVLSFANEEIKPIFTPADLFHEAKALNESVTPVTVTEADITFIVLGSSKTQPRMKAVADTWGSDVSNLLIFSDENDAAVPTIVLDECRGKSTRDEAQHKVRIHLPVNCSHYHRRSPPLLNEPVLAKIERK